MPEQVGVDGVLEIVFGQPIRIVQHFEVAVPVVAASFEGSGQQIANHVEGFSVKGGYCAHL
jgi:hypothetical protein